MVIIDLKDLENDEIINYELYFNNEKINGIQTKCIDFGLLTISSNRLIACDPLDFLTQAPSFNKTIKKGRYSVVACIKDAEAPEAKVCAIKIKFSDEQPVRFEPTTQKTTKDEANTIYDSLFGFPVNKGIICIADEKAIKSLERYFSRYYVANPDCNVYDDLIMPLINNHEGSIFWNHYMIPDSPHEVLFFTNGSHQGIFPCYWGIDVNDKVASFIIDFQTV